MRTMNIATSSNERYFGAVATMLNSLFKNHDNLRIDVYFLYYDMTQESLVLLETLAEKYDGRLISIRIDIEKYRNFPVDNYSIETCFRLELPELLPELDRILYLDADLIIRKSIEELYNIDFNGYYLAAGDKISIAGELYERFSRLWKHETPVQYFNAGVLMMNLKMLREHVCFKDYEDMFIKYRNQLVLPDEFLLNLMFYNRTLKFSSDIYNFGFWCGEQHCEEEVCIIHYINCKPWLGEYRQELDEFLKIWWENVPSEGLVGYRALLHADEKIQAVKAENKLLYNWKNVSAGRFLKNGGIREAAVYGIGRYGRVLCDELLEAGVRVKYILDKAGTGEYRGIPVREAGTVLEPVGLLIFATGKYDEMLRSRIKKNNPDVLMVTLRELTDKMKSGSGKA